MKRKSRPKILFGICITLLQIVDQCRADRNCTSIKNENIHGRNAFSPRMDFNQWKPLGRGDPLKNDPTYDYVPPVLDQVHYWMEPAMRKPDPPLPEDSKKTEILLLGVLSKKSASPPLKVDSRRDNLDTYHKKEPKYNPHQRIAKPTFSFFPESLFNTLSKYTSTETKQNIPYTVLMPPPMNYNPTQTSTTNNFMPSTSPHVTIQPSHLIYQSSSLSDEKEWLNKNQYATVSSSTSWKTSTIKPYVLTTKNYRENLVFNKNLQPPESFIHIEFSPRNYSLIGADSNYNLNYVTPPSLKNAVNLHKGSISDNSAELHNTYVKIEKPEFYSTALSGNDDYVSVNTAPLVEIYTHMQHPVEGIKNMKHPVRDPEMETIKNMQTLLPPPTTGRPIYKESSSNPILNALIKEKQKNIMKTSPFLSQTPTVLVKSTTTDTPATTKEWETTTNTVYVTETEPTTFLTTTPSPPPTTTTPTTTMDPIFQYFKKPEEASKNPVYFVIQGHSKVKTYGPSKQVHGISVQETNEIFDDDKSPYKVKHLHTYRKDNTEEFNHRLGRSGNFQTLEHVVQSGLGSIDDEFESKNRRKDVKETILHFGYNVAEEGEATSETYHKGIVEEARKLKI